MTASSDRWRALRPVTIREATTEDFEVIAAICRETLADIVTAAGGDASKMTGEYLRTVGDGAPAVVAQVDGEVVGYMQYQVLPPHLILHGTAVRPSHQRHGITTATLTWVVEHTPETCTTARIGVQPTNPVHNWYRSLGFVITERKDWVDVMEMSLDPIRVWVQARGQSQ